MDRRIALGIVLAAALAAGGCVRRLAPVPLDAGVAAAQDDRWDEALRLWIQALELAPDSAAVHNNLAVAYERLGDWDQAAREYEAALRLDPENARVKGNYESFKARVEAGRGRRS